jgi:hypothetical protein
LRVRRAKPYVCVDIDFAEHHRFQATADVDAAAGTWLRCLAYSRAQEQDGIVKAGWLRRTFAANYERVDELVKVGLLCLRPDGDYEIHAYAPRNQTRAMIEEERASTRERVRHFRRSGRSDVTRYKRVTNGVVTITDHASASHDAGPHAIHGAARSHTSAYDGDLAAVLRSDAERVTDPSSAPESEALSSECETPAAGAASPSTDPVTRYKAVTSDVVTPYKHVSNAFVPTSIKASLSSSSLEDDSFLKRDLPDHVRAVPRADAPARAHAERPPLPTSERSLSGPFWLAAFSDGIREQTGRPCSIGRVFLGTLERIVTHHAPERDAAGASAWLKDQAKAFAAQWDGKHPAKGLTPDGLERWLNEGRQAPPAFGRSRIVQPPADKWQGDDWSDLGAQVDE